MTKPSLSLFILAVLLTCFSFCAFAQKNNEYRLKGIVQHANSEPIGDASVYAKEASTGQVIDQKISNADGTFSFSLGQGNYVIVVSYLGTIAYQSDVIKLVAHTDLGPIKIKTATQNLKEVVIQSFVNKPVIKVEGRKMIYSVENSITAQGGNTLEALKRTPGIIVNQENAITLNGSSAALVMINGRQTYLQPEELARLLKSMSSSDLKSIEVIKNPSAEYDAAGTGGIVNLVLKKSIAEGFNGNINAGVAYGSTLKQNTNFNLNYRKNKVNLFASYSHNFGHYAMYYDNDRTTNGKVYLNGNADTDKRHNIGSTLGIDYAIDTTKIIGLVMNGNFSNGGGLIVPTTNIYDQSSSQLLQTLRSRSDYPNQKANRYNANLNYRYKGSNNTNLDIDADYAFFDAATENSSTNAFYGPDGQLQSTNNFLVMNSRDIKLYALKADYGFPIAKGKIAIGSKFSNVDAHNAFDQYDTNGSTNVLDINLSNTFKYKEQITAGYLKYETPLSEAWSLDLGVRLEHTHSEGNLQPRAGSSQAATSVTRNYLDVFPTAGLTYKTKEAGTYNLSFARRIDRPAYNNLNPFSYPVDELSYWKGNPFLQPQYSNALSLQYSYKTTTIAGGYMRISDLTGTVTEVFNSSSINMVPRNIGTQDNFNVTVTQQVKLAKWWDMTLTGIGYYLKNKVGTAEYGNYQLDRFAGTVNIQQSFRLPGRITAEAAAIVNSKTITGLNTYVKGNSQIDLGVQKNLMNDKATLKLAVSDLFRGNQYNTNTQLNNMLLRTTFRAETRQVRLNFSYRFGNNKIKAQESRESGLQNESKRL